MESHGQPDAPIELAESDVPVGLLIPYLTPIGQEAIRGAMFGLKEKLANDRAADTEARARAADARVHELEARLAEALPELAPSAPVSASANGKD